jgi:hypothetical protein
VQKVVAVVELIPQEMWLLHQGYNIRLLWVQGVHPAVLVAIHILEMEQQFVRREETLLTHRRLAHQVDWPHREQEPQNSMAEEGPMLMIPGGLDMEVEVVHPLEVVQMGSVRLPELVLQLRQMVAMGEMEALLTLMEQMEILLVVEVAEHTKEIQGVVLILEEMGPMVRLLLPTWSVQPTV